MEDVVTCMTVPHKHGHCNLIKTVHLQLHDVELQFLTFEFVVLRVSRKKAVGEELGKGEACILWPVLNIVPHCGLELLHELWWGRAQLLDHLVPLVDIWCGGSGLREMHVEYAASCHPLCLWPLWPSIIYDFFIDETNNMPMWVYLCVQTWLWCVSSCISPPCWQQISPPHVLTQSASWGS